MSLSHLATMSGIPDSTAGDCQNLIFRRHALLDPLDWTIWLGIVLAVVAFVVALKIAFGGSTGDVFAIASHVLNSLTATGK